MIENTINEKLVGEVVGGVIKNNKIQNNNKINKKESYNFSIIINYYLK